MAAPTRTPRASWVEEGLRALGLGGPDAVRIEKLAQTLGVTKGGFYWHFDGRPALLEQSFGKGYSLLFTSTAGMKWNDFCLQGGIFVPFIHEAMKHLSVHSEVGRGTTFRVALPVAPAQDQHAPAAVG